jgi:hypothetical protein
MRETQKYFVFTIDDNIRFFRELTEWNCESLFVHPYLALFKKLHDSLGLKVQLNCFQQEEDTRFQLSRMSDKYRAEWETNASWLKLSFHSKKEFPIEPYKQSDYAQLYNDCIAVNKEIERFAGNNSLAKTTTVHYCLATENGVKALKSCGVKGLLGLYGTEENPQDSYDCVFEESERIRQGLIVEKDGVYHAGIDVILNLYETEEIVELLERLNGRNIVKIMIHEQYFYPDYAYYQSDFQEKIEKVVRFLKSKVYESAFFEELL